MIPEPDHDLVVRCRCGRIIQYVATQIRKSQKPAYYKYARAWKLSRARMDTHIQHKVRDGEGKGIFACSRCIIR